MILGGDVLPTSPVNANGSFLYVLVSYKSFKDKYFSSIIYGNVDFEVKLASMTSPEVWKSFHYKIGVFFL